MSFARDNAFCPCRRLDAWMSKLVTRAGERRGLFAFRTKFAYAVQGSCRSPPPHIPAAAQGDELGGI
jgi:hypothetical protein